VERNRLSVYFLFFAWRLWKSVVTLAVTGNTTFRSAFPASESAGVSVASIAVDRKSMGHTVAERSCNEADCLCISIIWHGGYGKVL
jgi:hypothetical protein